MCMGIFDKSRIPCISIVHPCRYLGYSFSMHGIADLSSHICFNVAFSILLSYFSLLDLLSGGMPLHFRLMDAWPLH